MVSLNSAMTVPRLPEFSETTREIERLFRLTSENQYPLQEWIADIKRH
ncbi:MAG TPA: hypothetical protein VFP93_04890 [Gammaproteobacteria bacterium]|nr:hypothetical protein [Gammaproteobacteria bacterium]